MLLPADGLIFAISSQGVHDLLYRVPRHALSRASRQPPGPLRCQLPELDLSQAESSEL